MYSYKLFTRNGNIFINLPHNNNPQLKSYLQLKKKKHEFNFISLRKEATFSLVSKREWLKFILKMLNSSEDTVFRCDKTKSPNLQRSYF